MLAHTASGNGKVNAWSFVTTLPGSAAGTLDLGETERLFFPQNIAHFN